MFRISGISYCRACHFCRVFCNRVKGAAHFWSSGVKLAMFVHNQPGSDDAAVVLSMAALVDVLLGPLGSGKADNGKQLRVRCLHF